MYSGSKQLTIVNLQILRGVLFTEGGCCPIKLFKKTQAYTFTLFQKDCDITFYWWLFMGWALVSLFQLHLANLCFHWKLRLNSGLPRMVFYNCYATLYGLYFSSVLPAWHTHTAAFWKWSSVLFMLCEAWGEFFLVEEKFIGAVELGKDSSLRNLRACFLLPEKWELICQCCERVFVIWTAGDLAAFN